MPVLRTALGLTADCTTCKRWFQDGVFEGTSTELIHAMRAADWTTQPVVCADCATRIHVWRNEGQPSDTDPKRRKAEKAKAAAIRAAAPSRRRRSIDTVIIAESEADVLTLAAAGVKATSVPTTPSPRRRRTLI